MKIRSMACLIKKPVEFKERILINQVQKDRFINGHVIKENGLKRKQTEEHYLNGCLR